ncbi:hypothetical protein [Tepidibacter hydrothermalis]|uniref:Uncharacterized protein n=1 Tax=Tepidibacter hydrothermalis TaxID=3036126 RepID=A0ABY8ECZ3_9FIRM|nr:hypothetical protein [Tepidibacter hydrothermalis]WFD10787.1 hypothetical protein P4S50_01540 [Tepidibacter hydrothermalis]
MNKIRVFFLTIRLIIRFLLVIGCGLVPIIYPNVSKKLSLNPIYMISLFFIATIIYSLNDFKELLKSIKENINKIRNIFEWKPSTPIINTKAIKSIETYPINYKFNLETLEIENEMVQGIESFKIMLIKFVNTEKNKFKIYEGTNYGTEYTLFTIDNNTEFFRQAEELAKQIIEYFLEWIEKIYSIKREKKYLIIEMKVYGKADTLFIKIPNANLNT